jgi:hypothetical protein
MAPEPAARIGFTVDRGVASCVNRSRHLRSSLEARIKLSILCWTTSGIGGMSWRETDVKDTDLEAVITDLLEGQYRSPVRVVGFNTAQGWARDVSEDVADEIRRRCGMMAEVPANLRDFVERHDNRDSNQLRLD